MGPDLINEQHEIIDLNPTWIIIYKRVIHVFNLLNCLYIAYINSVLAGLIFFNIFAGILYRLKQKHTSSVLHSGGLFEVYRYGQWVPVCLDYFYYYRSYYASPVANLICQILNPSFNGTAAMSYYNYHSSNRSGLHMDNYLAFKCKSPTQLKDYLASIQLSIQSCYQHYITCLDVSGMSNIWSNLSCLLKGLPCKYWQ